MEQRQRAYSAIQVEAVNEEKRVLRGVATTYEPEPERKFQMLVLG